MQRIKTNIKFSKGLNNIESQFYGFVTKQNGSWRGCRADDGCKKKIVIVDEEAAKDMLPNTLYRCSLIPMRNENGFIAKTATAIRFKVTIHSVSRGSKFYVLVCFGNKEIIYDPASKDKRKNNIQTIANGLRKRVDLENPNATAEDFIDAACLIQRLYKSQPQKQKGKAYVH